MRPWRILLFMLCASFSSLVMAENSVGHETDPIAVVILWVTLIFFFAITGRYLAKRFNQPGVLGELLMGVLLGNVCYFLDVHLFVVLREGSAVFNIMREMLNGIPLNQAVNA